MLLNKSCRSAASCLLLLLRRLLLGVLLLLGGCVTLLEVRQAEQALCIVSDGALTTHLATNQLGDIVLFLLLLRSLLLLLFY